MASLLAAYTQVSGKLCDVSFSVDVPSTSLPAFVNVSVEFLHNAQNQPVRATPFSALISYASGVRRTQTPVNVIADSVRMLIPTLSQGEIINTAVLTGLKVTVDLKIMGNLVSGALIPLLGAIPPLVVCTSATPSVLKVDAACRYVYVDGTETASAAAAVISVSLLNSTILATVRMRVWFPRFPVLLNVSLPFLQRIGTGRRHICTDPFMVSPITVTALFGWNR